MTRRRFLMASAITAAALALSACGTTEAAEAPAAAPTSARPIELTDGAGTKITLPGPATKVVGLEWAVVENLVSLGVEPVGVADVTGYNNWSSAVALTNTPKDVGKRGEPSVDSIAALAPDLILATDDLPAAAVKQLQKVAPVMLIKPADASAQIARMNGNLDLIAQATGTEDKATAVKAAFQEKLTAGKAALATAGVAGQKFVFADGWVESNQIGIRPYAKGSLLSDVTEDLGLTNAWTGKGDQDYGLAVTDVEGLTKLGDVQYLYLANDADGGKAFEDALAGNKVWTSLPFVKDGNVHRLPDGIWMFAGPATMGHYVDGVVAALTK
jgi:ABC-type Fe3+-hydroxamate transport system substrate-binding protein